MTAEFIFNDRSSYLDPLPMGSLHYLRNTHDHHCGNSNDFIKNPGLTSTSDISELTIGWDHHRISSLDNRTQDDLGFWDGISCNQQPGHDTTGHGTDSDTERRSKGYEAGVSGTPTNNTRLPDEGGIRSVSELFHLDKNGELWEEREDRYSIRTDGSTVSTFARDDDVVTGARNDAPFGEEVDPQREPFYHLPLDDDEPENLQFQNGGMVMFKNENNSPGDKKKKKRKPSVVRSSAWHVISDTPTIHKEPGSKKEDKKTTTIFSAWSPAMVTLQLLVCVFILTVCGVILGADDTVSDDDEEPKMRLPCLDLSHFYPIAAWYKNTDRETNERFKVAGIQRVKGDKNNNDDISCEVSTSLVLGLMARNEYGGVGGEVTLAVKESGPTLGYSTYTLSIKAVRNLRNVLSDPKGLIIAQEGIYFVYFGLQLNYKDAVCRKLRFKTAIAHFLVQAASGQPPKALMGSEYTCAESRDTEKATMFTGGLFYLRPDDRLFIQVSSAHIIGDLNYFGVFRLPTH